MKKNIIVAVITVFSLGVLQAAAPAQTAPKRKLSKCEKEIRSAVEGARVIAHGDKSILQFLGDSEVANYKKRAHEGALEAKSSCVKTDDKCQNGFAGLMAAGMKIGKEEAQLANILGFNEVAALTAAEEYDLAAAYHKAHPNEPDRYPAPVKRSESDAKAQDAKAKELNDQKKANDEKLKQLVIKFAADCEKK